MQGGTWDAFFWVNDGPALHSDFTNHLWPLIQESYQMNEFAIRNCDGHVVGFEQSLEPETE